MKDVQSTTKNLYALVIGINAYDYVTPLNGCVHDADTIADYLQEPFVQEVFNLHLERLTDGAATKEAIVDGFRNHLGKAKEGDTALLFFAGHGHREQTSVPAFKRAEIDGKIGNLVCVDSKGRGGSAENTCLADKELRYLIQQLSKQGPEIITIFDCCHSGDNTRNVETPDNARKISTGAAQARPWEGFIFHEAISPTELESGYLEDVIPEGKHIQLAACRDVELAWEFNGSGAFTGALVETLRSHQGRIRYHDLYSRIRNRMRQTGEKQQTPQIHVQTGNPADRYRIFLTNAADDQPISTSVIYNASEDEWRINIGALHGLPADPKDSDVSVQVFPVADAETLSRVELKTVNPSYSIIVPEAGISLNEKGLYRARIGGLAIKPLDLYVKGDVDSVETAKSVLGGKLDKADFPFARFTEAETSADYVLELKDGLLIMRKPGCSKPILQPVQYLDGDRRLDYKSDYVHSDLLQMAKWTFLKDLEHCPVFPGTVSDSSPHKQPIELKLIQKVWRDGEEVEVSRDLSKGIVSFDLTHDRETKREVTALTKNAHTMIRMELINHSDQELFCSLLYLSQEFGVSFPFFQQAEFWLRPNQTVNSKQFGNQPYIYGSMPGYAIEDGWDGVCDYLKLIVSETQFDSETLAMDDLPSPGASSERGGFDMSSQPDLPKTYWSTQTVELFNRNPHVTST